MSKKHEGNTNAVKHGKHSVMIDKFLKKLDASPLSKVEKMQFEDMLNEVVARGLAFDIDSYLRQYLIDNLEDFDAKIMNYQSDLFSTQSKLNDMERNVSFHKKVLLDLKEEYASTSDVKERNRLLDEIDKREAQITDYETRYNRLIKTRNDIRKEVDKNNYNEAALKQKEKALQSRGDLAISVDSIDMDGFGDD